MVRVCRAAAAALIVLATVASIATAQTPDGLLPSRPLPSVLAPPDLVVFVSPERIEELQQWATDFEAWRSWAERWLSRRQPGLWNNYVERTQKPDPPAWLDEACGLLSGDEPFTRACGLLASWREDPLVTQSRHASVASVAQIEAPTKTAWWQHVHVDGLWSSTQSNMMAFGLFGAHVTLDVAGRLQTFIAPGILLVSLPTISGRRELAPATDFGISYRLFDVGRNTVHFNMAHAWMLGNRPTLWRPNLVLAGLSVSFRRVDARQSR